MIFLQHLFWLNQICSFVQYSVPYWALLNMCNFIFAPFIHDMTEKKAEILERGWKTSHPQFIFVFIYTCLFASTECCPSEEAKACTQLKCLIDWMVEKGLHVLGCLGEKIKPCSDGEESRTCLWAGGGCCCVTSSPPGPAERGPNWWTAANKSRRLANDSFNERMQ